MAQNSRLYKMLHWEFWPSYMFYIPNIPYAFYLALKAKSPVFFSAVNPGIHNSGNGFESKYDTIQMLPESLRPITLLIKQNTPFEEIIEQLKIHSLEFPIIAKPDIGFRGLLVKKIDSLEELKSHLNSYPIDFILQEFVDLPNECGIFYYRIPDEQEGKITSITLKEFLSVKGDGIHTIKELIEQHERAVLYLPLLEELHGNQLGLVLENNLDFVLNEIGNHSKGTRFINGNHLINKKLESALDALNKQIDGWYYGRIDLKFDSFDDILNGKNYKILEINGIIAEPTHIYDAQDSSYFKAIKAIANHWKTIYKIAVTNHFVLHYPYTKTKDFLKEMKSLKRYTKNLKTLAR
ncbi:D-alanine--D-alanine ligase [Urechidicola sp. KH5]